MKLLWEQSSNNFLVLNLFIDAARLTQAMNRKPISLKFLELLLLEEEDEIFQVDSTINDLHTFPKKELSFRKVILICRLEQNPKKKSSPRKPLLQYPTQELRSYFSFIDCQQIQASMKQQLEDSSLNVDIELQLIEIEQFYKELTIINQFFREPFNMPWPHHYINQLTRQLVIFLQKSNNIALDIARLFNQNKILFDLTEEIYGYFYELA